MAMARSEGGMTMEYITNAINNLGNIHDNPELMGGEKHNVA